MNFQDALHRALHRPLPGMEAQKILSPEGRRHFDKNDSYRHAAVLICLYPTDDGYSFPLIHRVEDEYAHSNQIALPGGKIEPGESAQEAALREAEEEIGVEGNTIDMLGKLTPLSIPVSKFIVHPFVGVINGSADWRLNPGEVQSLIEIPLNWLIDETLIRTETWTLSGKLRSVPFFLFDRIKVWGATAMILSEFKQVLASLKESSSTNLNQSC